MEEVIKASPIQEAIRMNPSPQQSCGVSGLKDIVLI
jgi:hypothetical protein